MTTTRLVRLAGALAIIGLLASCRPGMLPRVRWRPAQGTSWQWQLTGPVDTSVRAAVFDIDLFDNGAPTVAALHARGRRVICYLSAGSVEDWRPDAARFPASRFGAPLDGWAGERWIDIRRIDLLGPIMNARMDLCRAKGFDAVEPDNIDAYRHRTGFPLTAAHQLTYNRYLAAAAHKRGLSIGLKNDLDQVRQLAPSFDFAINEECIAYDECDLLAPFIRAGKAVLHAEYDIATRDLCPPARARRLSSIRKTVALDAWQEAC